MPRPLDIMGATEAAQLFAVHTTTIYRWQERRYLPPPDAKLAAGPVWRTSTLLRWAERHGHTTYQHQRLVGAEAQ